ncbi:MAG: AAA family ATPase [Limnobacter sp.]|nr:AAA family ATPase [Limnobacter sp.]
MRLTNLRLAGFKSFVEPTNVAVPSNLVGVVGPNGCGKSNIIDAVRWVLGESKASELRGESMQDVIFNGSTNRKSASRASVELVFDNAEGRAGGSWNQYAEISVKRVLTRDGSSTYYINQQPVRRRDVQDIFLGTGLGPRAYAIIGQGMIARIIEARPEELRVFLEEAAGVSKYKERRRETNNRLQDTHDNLTRVEDIRRELTNQIERLEQQAEVARQYRDFESEKSTKQRLLWFIRLQEAQAQKDQVSAAKARAQAELEGLQAQSVRTQTALFSQREAQVLAQKTLESDQTQWIEINKSVSRLEADIRVMSESRSRLAARITELETEWHTWHEGSLHPSSGGEAWQHVKQSCFPLVSSHLSCRRSTAEQPTHGVQPPSAPWYVNRWCPCPPSMAHNDC